MFRLGADLDLPLTKVPIDGLSSSSTNDSWMEDEPAPAGAWDMPRLTHQQLMQAQLQQQHGQQPHQQQQQLPPPPPPLPSQGLYVDGMMAPMMTYLPSVMMQPPPSSRNLPSGPVPPQQQQYYMMLQQQHQQQQQMIMQQQQRQMMAAHQQHHQQQQQNTQLRRLSLPMEVQNLEGHPSLDTIFRMTKPPPPPPPTLPREESPRSPSPPKVPQSEAPSTGSRRASLRRKSSMR
jgi:hypothetical protein